MGKRKPPEPEDLADPVLRTVAFARQNIDLEGLLHAFVREAYHQTIRWAVAQGMSRRKVAHAAGLSFQRVDAIVHDGGRPSLEEEVLRRKAGASTGG